MKRIAQRTAGVALGLLFALSAWAGLETVTNISDLNAAWPLGSDLASTSDDHIRNIKTALKTDLPNMNGTWNSASAPPFAAGNNTNTGLYFPSANALGFATGGSARGSVNSTGNWVIPVPSSGNTVSVTQVAGSFSYVAQGGASTAAIAAFAGNSNVPATSDFTVGQDTAGNALLLQRANLPINISTNSVQRVSIGATGAVTVSAPTSGTAIQITGVAGANSEYLIASSTSGNSFGLRIDGGTTSADRGLLVNNQAGTTAYFQVRGDGAIQGGGPAAAALVDMTPDTTTATGTLTGCTTSPTTTVRLSRTGNVVVVSIDGTTTCTSNATTFSLTGAIPSSFQPARQQASAVPTLADNSVGVSAMASVTSGSSTITFSRVGANFTGSGTKGFNIDGTSFSYQLK